MDSGKTVFNGLDIEIHRGAVTAIMGPSGSGKSTLLYILGALEPASSGTVTLDAEAGIMEQDKRVASKIEELRVEIKARDTQIVAVSDEIRLVFADDGIIWECPVQSAADDGLAG